MVLGGSRGLLCRLVMGYSKHLELPNRAGLFWVVPQLAPGTRLHHLECPPRLCYDLVYRLLLPLSEINNTQSCRVRVL